jgi:hypothetical protein
MLNQALQREKEAFRTSPFKFLTNISTTYSKIINLFLLLNSSNSAVF